MTASKATSAVSPQPQKLRLELLSTAQQENCRFPAVKLPRRFEAAIHPRGLPGVPPRAGPQMCHCRLVTDKLTLLGTVPDPPPRSDPPFLFNFCGWLKTRHRSQDAETAPTALGNHPEPVLPASLVQSVREEGGLARITFLLWSFQSSFVWLRLVGTSRFVTG